MTDSFLDAFKTVLSMSSGELDELATGAVKRHESTDEGLAFYNAVPKTKTAEAVEALQHFKLCHYACSLVVLLVGLPAGTEDAFDWFRGALGKVTASDASRRRLVTPSLNM